MNLADIPLLGTLGQRMSWLSARQSLLSQNVANADTPGYLAKDLKSVDFASFLKNGAANLAASSLARTDPRHLAGLQPSGAQFSQEQTPDTLANPTGNTVSLEQEMIKVADTQAQYQAASDLYAKAVGMMRTAIGQP